ncbi:hypothetical protein [Pseudoalteromonas sp. S1612]|jgi:hypothetical protein|uniref:hypothetical protein n=1 Tax=Pseudoalteromonas sp. S1612 TaxID=579507 RepID=UPI00110BD418|nr:hypothetical protein [Pseudoalteromonas sp. S1612]TMP58261.1 hypothetical protein CWB78_00790 [Pseudoalteromonas sp. S1612]
MLDDFEGSYPSSYLNSGGELHGMHENPLTRKKLRKHVAINCWHRNEYESAAMWSLYLKSDEGVAIQTRVEVLVEELFEGAPDGYLPTVVPVKYIDFERDTPEMGFIGAYRLKRKSFEHENEVRAVVCKCDKDWSISGVEAIPESGISIPVDLNNLIENIFVSPTAPKWFLDLVSSSAKTYGLACKVHQSSLKSDSPLY